MKNKPNTKIKSLKKNELLFFRLFAVLFLVFTLHSCNDDDDSTTIPDVIDPTAIDLSANFGNEISRDFLGKIIDVSKNPIENVTITIGNATALTDANGIFRINNATVYERFGYIKAEKTGYIHGSRSVIPSTGTNKVTIMLLDKTVAGTVNSGNEETVSLSNGASVTFKGDFSNPDGSSYSGSVDVILHSLDATDEDIELQMPGMLYAANSSNEERMLQTLGMLAVELRGSASEDLNITEGSSAEIKIPLDSSLVATAPSSIPLWYFDEDKGYWIEDGIATLVGNEYIGTVTHFSFWNCDIPVEAINLCVIATNEDDEPLSNLDVRISSNNYGTRGGVTNENGEVCGLIPANETLTINVYNYNLCGNDSIYTSTIGPYASDDNLQITILSSLDIIYETVFGNFNDCSGNPVTNGYVLLNYGDQPFVESVTNGTFEVNLIRCPDENTFAIEAVDINAFETTGEINYTFSTPSTDLGTLTSCNAVTEFITYTIDGDNAETFTIDISATLDTSQSDSLSISASSNGTTSCFYSYANLNAIPYIGTYSNLDLTAGGFGFFIAECIDMTTTNNNITYNLTAFGNADEYIDVNFSGDYEDSAGNSHTINGVIHVLRDQ